MDNIEQFYDAWAPNHSTTYLNWKLINVQYFKEGWDWGAIAWKSIERRVFNLQKRIYRATKNGQYSKAYSLIKLLNRSSCNIVLSIRRVTQDNKGSRTAGIDKYRAISPKERVKLTKRLMEEARKRFNRYKASPLKRIYIPKANGKERPLGIPTQYDRVVQNTVKNSIEPQWEAEFTPESYGFRPAMGAQDAVSAIWTKIKNGPKWILDADIKGYFDNIDHNFILNLFDDQEKPIVKEWLKSGHIDRRISEDVIDTYTGTPQGGIISPLIANKVLDGMQRHLRIALKEHLKVSDPETEIYKLIQSTKVVRYADDFIVINKEKNIIVLAKQILKSWLKERGVELSEEKTTIVSSIEGFDFLGFHFQHLKGDKAKGNYRLQKIKEGKLNPENKYKLKIVPSDKSVAKHKARLKEIVKKAKAWSQEDLIKNLNRIIMGWANYFRFVDSYQCFNNLSHYVWTILWKWGRRRHKNKNRRWVKKKYFHTTNKSPKGWHFAVKKENKIKRRLNYHTEAIEKLNHRYYAMLKEGKSFYDGDTIYWSKRLSKGYGGISPSKARMLKKQDGRCPLCKGLFKNEDLIETHHIVFKSKGGDDKHSNLIVIHRHCHDQYHAGGTSGTISPKGTKRNNKVDKEFNKASKTLEVDEKLFIKLESTIKKELEIDSHRFRYLTDIEIIGKPIKQPWEDIQPGKYKTNFNIRLTNGVMMEMLRRIAKQTGENSITISPNIEWIKEQLNNIFDFDNIVSKLETSRKGESSSMINNISWVQGLIETTYIDLSKKVSKSNKPVSNPHKGKAEKARQFKATKTKHQLKRSKEASQNLKIRLLHSPCNTS